MQTNSQCADDKIVLSSAVLEHVKELSVAALKVYLYLGSYGPDRPIRAGINVIGNAVGLQRRSTIDCPQGFGRVRINLLQSGSWQPAKRVPPPVFRFARRTES